MNQKSVEIRARRVEGVEREDLGNVLIRTNHDEAASLPVNCPQIEDIATRLEVGTKNLFMIYQAVASFLRQEQWMKPVAVQLAVAALEDYTQIDDRIDVGPLSRETKDGRVCIVGASRDAG